MNKPDHRALVKVSHMYYMENLNLNAISKRTGLSISTVSRYLKRAKDSGIVSINIQTGDSEFPDLEKLMENTYGLRECFITSPSDSETTLYKSFSRPLADLLYRHTPENGLLGVSWGDTLSTAVRHFPENFNKKINVIPVTGGLGIVETGAYPNSIAQTIAAATGGQAFLVNVPAVLDSEETTSRMFQDRNLRAVLDLWKQLNTVVLGASSLDITTSLGRSKAFTGAELSILHKAGCRTAANFIMLDAQGKALAHPLEKRIFTLPFQSLKKTKTVILVAGGAPKIEPMKSVLQGGFIHCLVTDVESARALLSQA